MFPSDYKSVRIQIREDVYENGDFVKKVTNHCFDYTDSTTLLDLFRYCGIEGHALYNDHFDYSGVVDYLIINNRVIWRVPSDKCLLNDYLETYHENPIFIILPDGIGATGPDISNWIEKVNSYSPLIGLGMKVLSKLQVREIAKCFIGLDGKYATESEATKLIKSEKYWDFRDLKNKLQCKDETWLRCLLYSCGYISKMGDYYYYDEEKFNQIVNENSKYNDLAAKHNKKYRDL